MSTPFANFKNCTITFNVPIGKPTKDEYGADQVKFKPLKVEAMLNQKRKPMANDLGSGNEEEIYVEGRCVSPTTIPNSIVAQSVHSVKFDGGQEYQFKYVPTVASPFFSENQILGQALTGYLIQTHVWGQGQ